MTDHLEDFIRSNRESFDSEDMKKGWEHIEPKVLRRKTPVFTIKRMWWAAAAVAVICVGTSVFFLTKKSDVPAEQMATITNDDYNRQMTQFVQLIEKKQTELKRAGEEHPELYHQFIKDINSLDSSFSELKSDLPANPNKEVLVEAMIKNLQIQLDLLNRQLYIIRQIKQKSIGYENNPA